MKSRKKRIFHFHLNSKKANILFAFLLLFIAGSAQVPIDSMIARAKKTLFANDYPKAIELYSNCLKEAIRLKDEFNIGNAYIGIGICYDKTSDFENALINYYAALKAYESVGNVKKQAGTLKNIGNTYRILKSYEKSAEFLEQALQKYNQLKDSVGLSGVNNDIGLLFMDKEKPDTAIIYFKKVISIFKAFAPKEVNAYALNNLGLSYMQLIQYQDAHKYFSEALQAMKKTNNDYGLALVLNNIGNLFIKEKRFDDAIVYSLRGLENGKKILSKEIIANSFENLAGGYRGLSNYKEANRYLDSLLNLRDAIFREESAKSYAEMETKYQNEKKQKEIILLKKDNAIKDLDLTNQRSTRTFLMFTILFILAIAILIFRGYAQKKRLNVSLEIVNQKLNEANNSKTKLFSIISHDLRTPINSLFNFLQIQKSSPGRLTAEQQEKINSQIKNASENLLSSMEDLLIWSKSQMEKFEPIIEPIDLTELCNDIVNMNATSALNKNIALMYNCPPKAILYSDPNFLKISVRNLVTNAIKFTPSGGSVELNISNEKDTIVIIVKDTGEGINEEHLENIFTWNSIRSDSSGLGLRLAKEFTEKLNGSITVNSKIGIGTEFRLTFRTKPS